jgi:UDP-N-acetylglucosamine 2-epimerase
VGALNGHQGNEITEQSKNSMPLKILHIVGARPQFIKYSPVSRALEAFHATVDKPINSVLVHSGQHYDYTMSRVFFD